MIDLSIGVTRRARRGMLREWRLHALSVFSLAVAFVCLGAALLVVTNLKGLEDRWARAGRASVYLKQQASPEDVSALKDALARVPGVREVRYVSAGQAKTDFGARELGKSGDLSGIPVEAFPASLEVHMTESIGDAALADMVTKLKLLPGVEDVETYRSWTERLARLVRAGVAAELLLAFVVLTAVLAVVGSTIRLALQRRKTEVEVLKLVGASDRFVKGPFLLEGGAQGALGAAFAVGLLGILFVLVQSRLDGELSALVGMEPTFLPWPFAAGMVALGLVLGAFAAALGLRRLVAV